jgi:histidyl-tRNA synthetase
MEELQLIQKVSTPAPVFIPFFDATRLDDYLHLAARIRASGVGVEFYPEPKKLGQQLKYADRRGFRWAVIAGEDEWASGSCQIKDLATGQSTTVALADAPAAIVERLH